MSLRFLFLISIMLFYNLSAKAIQVEEKIGVNIGIVHDGLIEDSSRSLNHLFNEIDVLLGSKYYVQIKDDRVLDANWSAQNASEYYEELVQDLNIDIILGFGAISSSVIAEKKVYPKPVIVLGIINPEIHNLAPISQKTSGIDNFSYPFNNQSIKSDIDIFYKIYPYKNLGIVFFDEIVKLNPFSKDYFNEIMEKNNSQYEILSVKENVDDVLNNLEGIDAVYLGHLGKFEGKEKVRLIDEITKRGIPTFGFTVADAYQGALATINPNENSSKIFRRIALDIEAVLEGDNLSNMPVHISFEKKLHLNMNTAGKLKISPSFSVLYQAELLYEFTEEDVNVYNLKEVLLEAVETNLDLKIQELSVESYRKEVSIAIAKYLPSLTLSANGVQIDKNSAEKSFGMLPEKTISGTMSVQQVIFSEQVLGNISIQKHLLEANKSQREQIKLDIMLEAGESYLNILKAESNIKLRKENLNRIEKNLEISEQRESIGYSNLSDVYRWESQLASETKQLIDARNSLELAKMQLNKILHKPLGMNFDIEDVFSEDTSLKIFTNIKKYVFNPQTVEILTGFFIEEAKKESKEIQQIDASIAALQRSLKSINRQRYIPVIGLGAEADYTFSKSGIGSDPVMLNGQPIENEDFQWYIGINASLPIFNGGEIFHKSDQTNIDILKLEQEKENLIQKINLNVRAKVLDLSLSVPDMELSKRSADFASKSYYMVQDAYAKGSISIVELTDAQTNMLNAELASINSIYNFHIDLLRIQRAISNFLFIKSEEEIEDFSSRFEKYLREKY
jgi:outer membrane protein